MVLLRKIVWSLKKAAFVFVMSALVFGVFYTNSVGAARPETIPAATSCESCSAKIDAQNVLKNANSKQKEQALKIANSTMKAMTKKQNVNFNENKAIVQVLKADPNIAFVSYKTANTQVMKYSLAVVDNSKGEVVLQKSINIEKLDNKSVKLVMKNSPGKTKELILTKDKIIDVDGNKVYSVNEIQQAIQQKVKPQDISAQWDNCYEYINFLCGAAGLAACMQLCTPTIVGTPLAFIGCNVLCYAATYFGCDGTAELYCKYWG